MKSSWFQVGPKSNDESPQKRREEQGHKETGRRPCEELEIGATPYKPKDPPELPAASVSWREARNGLSPEPPEGTNPAMTVILDFQPPELWEHQFLLRRP